MGAWNTSLFSDDFAMDVREQFLDLLGAGSDPAEATKLLIEGFAYATDDLDDGPVFWMALAAIQWKYGCLADEVRDRALALIDAGAGLERWEHPRARVRRAAVQSALAAKLRSPQPRRRTPRPRPRVQVPSTTVVAPDGVTTATVFTRSQQPPSMQVCIMMLVDGLRGGGGACAGNCTEDAIELEWLDNRHLQITHPADLQFESRPDEHFVAGQIVKLLYRSST